MPRYYSPSTGLAYSSQHDLPDDAVPLTAELRDQILARKAMAQKQATSNTLSQGDDHG